jgi:hypothetical protein
MPSHADPVMIETQDHLLQDAMIRIAQKPAVREIKARIAEAFFEAEK